MPRKNGGKSKKGKKNNSRFPLVSCIPELRADLVPIRSDIDKLRQVFDSMRTIGIQQLVTMALPFQTTVSSDGSGNVQVSFSSDPSNSAYWTDWSKYYDEYRVLGMDAYFEPTFVTGGSSQLVRNSLLVVTDYDDATNLTGYDTASIYPDHKIIRGGSSFSFVSCENTLQGGEFGTIGSGPLNSFWMKLYSSNNNASFILGRLFIRYFVQFRGRGL